MEVQRMRIYKLSIMVLDGSMNIIIIRWFWEGYSTHLCLLPPESTKNSLECYFNKTLNYYELQGQFFFPFISSVSYSLNKRANIQQCCKRIKIFLQKAAQTSNNGNLHTKLGKDNENKRMAMPFCHEVEKIKVSTQMITS